MATQEIKTSVVTDALVPLSHVKNETARKLTSYSGVVTVTRNSYGQRQQSSRRPLDKQLNLPPDQYSDGMRNKRLLYDAIESIDSTTGGHAPKR